jgi:hypothetical protein
VIVAILLVRSIIDLGLLAAAAGGLLTWIAFLFVPRFLFPAVEIADTTPGRRLAQLATRGLGFGTVISTATALVGKAIGAS